jgi:hypothetical protein
MDEAPARVLEYAEQAVEYVRRALGVKLEYDSNTLPLLDHYIRTVPGSDAATLELVISTAGAYFGEVVRRSIGGRWEAGGKESEWRMVLPTGLSFSPMGIVASAIAQADLDDLDSEFDAPPRMKPYVQSALERMGEVSVEDYYSLCGRLDTLEHLHEVLVAVAAQMIGGATDDEAGESGDAPEAAVADEPSGGVPVN